MPPPRSKAWSFFTKLTENTASCNLCGNVVKYSGNTSNLFKHMKTNHPFQNETKQSMEGSEDSGPSTAGTSSSNEPCIKKCKLDDESQKPIVKSFQRMISYMEGGSKHQKITEAILYFICKDVKPFNVVNGKGFINLMKEVAPTYKIPSPKTFKKRLIEKYASVANNIKSQLLQINRFSLTMDIWTETMNERSYLGVTLHYLESTELKTIDLAVSALETNHTGENISQALENVLEKWEIPKEKIVLVVTDNGANMIAASAIFFGKKNYPNKHIGCFAHTINLIVAASLKHFRMLPLIEKVRSIVKFVKNSVKQSDMLRKFQQEDGIPEGEQKKLILDVQTRWNSTFYMVERFIIMVPFITRLIVQDANGPEMLSGKEIADLKQLQILLRPFEFVTKQASGDNYCTLSSVIPMVNILITELKSVKVDESSALYDIKVSLLKDIQERFSKVEDNNNMAISTILDPRFKNIHFTKPLSCANAMNIIRNVAKQKPVESRATSSSSSDEDGNPTMTYDFWQSHKQLIHGHKRKTRSNDELSTYLDNPLASLNSDPLKEWEDMKTIFPGLYKQARVVLMMPATSVPSERLFSKTGQVLISNRSRLSPSYVDKLMFLRGVGEEYWDISQ